MSTSDRPSGLTALAMISFLTGIFQIFGALTFLLNRFVWAHNRAKGEFGNSPEAQSMAESARQLTEVPAAQALIYGCLISLAAILLIVCGIGYMRRHRILGLHLTSVYVFVDLTAFTLMLIWMPESYIRELGIGVLRNAGYPVFAGLLIHTVFRRDFVR